MIKLIDYLDQLNVEVKETIVKGKELKNYEELFVKFVNYYENEDDILEFEIEGLTEQLKKDTDGELAIRAIEELAIKLIKNVPGLLSDWTVIN